MRFVRRWCTNVHSTFVLDCNCYTFIASFRSNIVPYKSRVSFIIQFDDIFSSTSLVTTLIIHFKYALVLSSYFNSSYFQNKQSTVVIVWWMMPICSSFKILSSSVTGTEFTESLNQLATRSDKNPVHVNATVGVESQLSMPAWQIHRNNEYVAYLIQISLYMG